MATGGKRGRRVAPERVVVTFAYNWSVGDAAVLEHNSEAFAERLPEPTDGSRFVRFDSSWSPRLVATPVTDAPPER
jgi:hypothetical protein